MEYRELGKTGMKVSELAFGASSLGGVFHDLKEKEGIEAVHTAVDNGINLIDVSPYYGYYKAETVLGKALKEIDRNRYYLSTKVGRYGEDGHNTWDYSARRVTDSVYESMERLNVDYVDIINVHDIEFADLNQVVNETLPALVALKAKGVVKHVGITDLQLENLKWVIERVPEGTVESVLNFCHYCLCDDKLVDFLDFSRLTMWASSMRLRSRWVCSHVVACPIGIRHQRHWSQPATKQWNIATHRIIRSRNLPCSSPSATRASPQLSSAPHAPLTCLPTLPPLQNPQTQNWWQR
jgi:diketogulonate reductase-like aldo/keto reductase